METRMHFARMDQGTDEDFQLLKLVHERALEARPDLLLGLLNDLSADSAYNLKHARDRFKDEPWYAKTVDFCASWDEVSFDPAYPNEPVSTFEPMLRRVLDKPWIPPTRAK